MKWVTRENIHVDRTACPWLIKKFIDPEAEFVFVPRDTDPTTLKEGIPFDMKGVELGHHDNRCSFKSIVKKYDISDPIILEIAKIIHAADISADRHSVSEGECINLLTRGIRLISKDDYEALEKAFVLYDALYAAIKWRIEEKK